MAAIFQIRRGSGSIAENLQDGELYLNEASRSLYIGTNNASSIQVAKLNEINSGSLTLSGNLSASNAWISGNVRIEGNLLLGNQTTDTITATGEFTSDLIPNPTDTYNFGSDSKRWKRIYANSVSASAFTGSLYGMGDPNSFSTSVDSRLDILEASASLYDNAMSGSNRLYVSPSGSDANDGSDPSVPFRTIKAAVASLGSAIPGNIKRYTIFVGSGNYTEQNPIAVPPGVAIVGDTLRTVRLTAANPTKDFFHTHDANYFYGLRFLDLQYPAFAFSFPSSTAKATISGNSVSSISIVHSLSGYTNGNNQDLGIIIEGPDASGSIATATANVSGGIITQINVVSGGNNYTSTEKPHISIPAPIAQRPIITTSPYVQNCSAITGPFDTSGNKVYRALPYDYSDIDEQGAGGGIRIDGNLVSSSSPLESFVADAFTQVNQGGPGHLVINKGYAQFVSCFTTFCTYGFKVANGGFANISNSVIDFGKYGLISKTYYPTAYNTAQSLETKTSVISGFVIDENGAGYTGSIAGVTIVGGGGYGATAQATVNANGSINEIVLLTPGSGYTYEPTVTIDAPTGAGAIQAYTIGGKAKISGVTGILINLNNDIRGIDISSNMVLNGINYLVTNVTTGNNASQKRVTTYPAPPSIQSGDSLNFYPLSNISTGGLVMEYVGSGVTYNALPKFGGVPDRAKEINQILPGRVFYSTVDNIGNLKIGDFFAVNQLTGEVTITANSFNLSGLNAIGPFKRNGVGVGVVLQEVSNNTTLLNAEGNYGEDTVPTQYAVKGYIDVRDARLNKLEQTSGSLNQWTASAKVELNNLEITSASNNSRLNNLETKSASVDISISKLHSYTSSLNTAIQLTGSTVSFLGNIVVYGTQSIINSTNLEVADNLIYLNATSSTTNVDLGIIGHYNDGTYRHGGIFRSATDGAWRVFKNYQSEISGTVNLTEPTFAYADFYANALSASTLNGIGNVTSYSTSVDSRLVSLETTTTNENGRLNNLETFSSSILSQNITLETYTSSINNKISLIQSFTSSANTRLTNLEASSGSLNSFTQSTNTKFDYVANTTQSLNTFTASASGSLNNLELFSSSVLTQHTTLAQVTSSLQLYTASANSWSGGIDGKFTTLSQYTASLNTFTSSTNIRLNNLETTSASVNISVVNINSYTASISTSFGQFSSSYHLDSASFDYRISVLDPGNLTANLSALLQWTASAKIELTNLELTTSSLNLFSSSINTTIKNKLNADGVLSGSSGNYQFNSIGIGMAASATAGRIDASGDIVAYSTSDINFKENIVPIKNALDKVENISGNEYIWKNEFEYIHGFKGNDVGVIAQEIQKVLPEAVRERENGYLGVNYEKIIPLLIQSIKELSAKVKELENK